MKRVAIAKEISLGSSLRIALLLTSVLAFACSQQKSESATPTATPQAASAAKSLVDPSTSVEGTPFEELPSDVQEQLAALGYVITSDVESEETGTTVHDVDRVAPGWNLYSSMMGQKATLVDVNGRLLHEWSAPPPDPDAKKSGGWPQWFRTVYLFPNGDLLAQTDWGPVVRLDKNSKLLWRYGGRPTHHDVDIASDGRVMVLAGGGTISLPGFESPIGHEFVVELDSNGNEQRSVSIVQALTDGGFSDAIDELRAYQENNEGPAKHDVTHVNTLEILGTPAPGLPEAFRPGHLLLSFPTIDRLFIMDFERGLFVWSQKGTFRYQHHPTLLPNGRLLLFDNLGAGEERSRVLEIDPATGNDLWDYGSGSDPHFYTRCCGRVHPQPNGNLLVVVSMEGYAFEVTRDREVVWEFRIPDRLAGKVPILNDVLRIDPQGLDASFLADIAGRSAH